MCEKKLIRRKEWFESCAMFFKDGVEEMTRNASCIIKLFFMNNMLHFPKEVSKSNPLFEQGSLPNLSMKISYFAYKCTQKG